ncbi:MAG TPA: GNAT family N-acetyltransferase [Trebonia sp.]|nr:GNAT family N-acetyltransferase [Trebonia sp.]
MISRDEETKSGTVTVPAEGLSFRRARLDDVDAVVGLVESAYRGESSRAGWTTEADLLDGQRTDATQVSDIVRADESVVLLAEQAGAVLGCCELRQWAPEAAYFGMFAVRPSLQGRGVGRALIREAERHAAGRWRATSMRMTVIRQRTDLIAWYERLGYAPTGETAPFPYGDDRFGRPRRDDLEFIVLARALPAP